MLLLKTAKAGISPGFLQMRLCLGKGVSFKATGRQSEEESRSMHACAQGILSPMKITYSLLRAGTAVITFHA